MSNTNTDTKIKSDKKKKKFLGKILIAFLVLITTIILILIPIERTRFKTLQNGDWNNEIGTLNFNPNLHFSYYNAGAGSPVGDADLYPNYLYLGNNNFITLGIGSVKKGKIHLLDDRCLIITYDGSTLFFANSNAIDEEELLTFNEYSTCDKCFCTAPNLNKSYFYCSIKDINQKNLTICPFNLKNKEETKAYSYTFALNDTVNYDYTKQESKLIDEFTVYEHSCTAKDLTKQEAISMIKKDNSLNAYVNFNNKCEISNIIIVDQTSTILELNTLEKAKLLFELEERYATEDAIAVE